MNVRRKAEKFYRELAAQGVKVGVGMEAQWACAGLSGCWRNWSSTGGFGDAAEIRTKRAHQQKTDRQDAPLILRLMLKDDLLQIWMPLSENGDLRQLLCHRMVDARTRIITGCKRWRSPKDRAASEPWLNGHPLIFNS